MLPRESYQRHVTARLGFAAKQKPLDLAAKQIFHMTKHGESRCEDRKPIRRPTGSCIHCHTKRAHFVPRNDHKGNRPNLNGVIGTAGIIIMY